MKRKFKILLFFLTLIYCQFTISNSFLVASEEQLIPITINVIPKDAFIRILDIKPKYSPGLLVSKGLHRIRIEKKGYKIWDRWLRINQKNKTFKIKLKRKPAKNNSLLQSDITSKKKLNHSSLINRYKKELNLYKSLIIKGEIEEALKPGKRVLNLVEQLFPPDHEYPADREAISLILDQLSAKNQTLGHFDKSEAYLKRSIIILEEIYGKNNIKVARNLKRLADLYMLTKVLTPHKAKPLLLRTIKIIKSSKKHIEKLAESYIALGRVYAELYEFKKSQKVLKHALLIKEKKYGKKHPDIIEIETSLKSIELFLFILDSPPEKLGKYHEQIFQIVTELILTGQPFQALPFAEKYLAVAKIKLDRNPDIYSQAAGALAPIYQMLGRYDEAENLVLNAQSLIRKNEKEPFRKWHLAITKTVLARVYIGQNRFKEAEQILLESISTLEKSQLLSQLLEKLSHKTIVQAKTELGLVYLRQDNTNKAEKLLKEAYVSINTNSSLDFMMQSTIMQGLSNIYFLKNKNKIALKMIENSLLVLKKSDYANSINLATAYDNIGVILASSGYLDRAEKVFLKSIEIKKRHLPNGELSFASSLDKLALLYMKSNNSSAIEKILNRSLSIKIRYLKSDHPNIATTYNLLGITFDSTNQFTKAEKSFKKAISIYEKYQSSKSKALSTTYLNLGLHYKKQKLWLKAYEYFLAASENINRIPSFLHSNEIDDNFLFSKNRTLGSLNKQITDELIEVGYKLKVSKAKSFELVNNMFVQSQSLSDMSAARALEQMAMRYKKGEIGFANLIRKRQDLFKKKLLLDRKLASSIMHQKQSNSNVSQKDFLNNHKTLNLQIDEINKNIKNKFPRTEAVLNTPKLTIKKTMQWLKPDEVLVRFYLGFNESFLWVISKNTASKWVKIPLTRKQIHEKVYMLRCGLDTNFWRKKTSETRCQKLLKTNFSRRILQQKTNTLLPFNLSTAHELYEKLFGQIKNLIQGKKLLIVADGSLTMLPFQVLITQPTTSYIANVLDYKRASWFGSKYAITILPSVTSLKALRDKKQLSRAATKKYIGFGNPLLVGKDGKDKSAWNKQKCSKKGLSKKLKFLITNSTIPALRSFYHDRLANVETLKRQSPLPETADELCAVAQSLGVPESNIYIGKNATESKLKSLNKSDLKDYRYIHFATHGLLSGELKSQAEHALILTPPNKATEQDDGLLTASEVTNLKLNADWVILSACNTAAGEKLGAEPFSGLARAFFYAGAKSLLVSHWTVDSEATVKLITKSFEILKQSPKIGRAEALRQSMNSLMNDDTYSWNAHPSTWAPFVVVGEGAGVH